MEIKFNSTIVDQILNGSLNPKRAGFGSFLSIFFGTVTLTSHQSLRIKTLVIKNPMVILFNKSEVYLVKMMTEEGRGRSQKHQKIDGVFYERPLLKNPIVIFFWCPTRFKK